MPAFARAKGGPLTDAQVEVLADGIKPRWGPAASGEAPPPYLSPAGTRSGNPDEGARVFARACAGCHGRQGQGGEHGERPVGAINDPAFLALISDQALRRIVDHRPARSRHAGLRRHGRPAGRFPPADLGARSTTWSRCWRPGGRAGRPATNDDFGLTRGRNDGPGFQLAALGARTRPRSGAALVPALADLRARRRRRGRGGPPLRRLPLRGARRPRSDWVALGRVADFPPDETRLVTFDNPIRQPWDGMAAHTGVYVRNEGQDDATARRPVPGLRRQLRPPGLPGLVVPAVGPVHVPLPRRRLLRQRRTRLRPAAARPLPLRLAGDASRRRLQLEIQAPHYPTLQDTLEQAMRSGSPTMKRWLLAVGDWFDARLRLRETLLPMLRHPIPREAAGPMGWWYVFGSASHDAARSSRSSPASAWRWSTCRPPTRRTRACST